jgi:hypothetical protein
MNHSFYHPNDKKIVNSFSDTINNNRNQGMLYKFYKYQSLLAT